MKFCSQCGSPVMITIPPGDNRERHVCRECDTIHYQNPRIIAGCIPVYQDRVLLCKRAIAPRDGFWTLPAGFLENGETSLQGALRECREEARASVKNPILAGFYDIPHINQVYVFFRGELKGPEYSAGEESLEVELFSEAELPWGQLAFPVVELALHHYFEDSKNNSFPVRTGAVEKPWKWIRS